jgi:WD40 repeat protein
MMDVETPEISWHNEFSPIWSVDWNEQRLATAGADHSIRIWQCQSNHALAQNENNKNNNNTLNSQDKATTSDFTPSPGCKFTSVTFLANLEFHGEAVNAVKFSPDGKYLASASDGKKPYMLYFDAIKCTRKHILCHTDSSCSSAHSRHLTLHVFLLFLAGLIRMQIDGW